MRDRDLATNPCLDIGRKLWRFADLRRGPDLTGIKERPVKTMEDAAITDLESARRRKERPDP